MAEKIEIQGELQVDPDKLERARTFDQRLQDLGRTLLGALIMLVRNVRLYAPDNAIFQRPLEALRDAINQIVAIDGSLSLQCAGEAFYLNNMLIRTELKAVDSLRALLTEFERCNVGGFLLSQSVTVPELQNFLYIFSQANAEQVGERGVSARKLQAMKLRRFEKLQEILNQQPAPDASEDARLDRKRYAFVVYSRLIVFMRKFIDGLRGEGPEIPLARSLHLIQDLVDVSHGHSSNFLGLTTLPHGEESLIFHLANTSVLSILFGSELGLTKEELRELGIAALFHDIGKLDLPEELLQKRDRLTPQENQQLAAGPFLSVLRLMSLGSLDSRLSRCLVAASDNALDYGMPLRDTAGQVIFVQQINDLMVFPRIIALVDTFDSLVSGHGTDPDLAVALMNSDWKHRFDPAYLAAFSKMMRGFTNRLVAATGQKVTVF